MINTLKAYLLTALLFAQVATFDLSTTSITIVQMTEKELHEARANSLLKLDPERLERGSWTEEELKESAKWDYAEYTTYLESIKDKIMKLGFSEVKITQGPEMKATDLYIKMSFTGSVSEKGNVRMASGFNLYQLSGPILPSP